MGDGVSGRMIDPVQDVERAGYRAEGWRSQRDLEERDEASLRFGDDRDKRLVIVTETFDFYRANVGASGAASYNMRVIVPTADATFEMTTTAALYVPAQARVIGARLHSNATTTAGTVQAEIRVTEDGVAADYAFEECELNTTNTTSIAAKFDWLGALQIAAGATIQLRAKADASFLPITADMWGRITLGYEEWVSS